MDYEKGKEIEEVIRDLQIITGTYGYNKKMNDNKELIDLETIYKIINNNVQSLKKILGQDN